ncbi:PREDICTED: armadillo repeat-containing protein 5-like [Acromyrmex echinatior]|uniref:Armadillo repeat-containing protein 5 n=2 Tax=Acromyrmex TaxID=64782 RepID=F4WEI6_ACREC|nr:PREDICTED: armadillo repeat-containing protein 5-like [Acromyrmex echinatior]EGI67349.1 Armadillo repeat-containing protein 5 [Acromyrmex echinatior]
MSRGSHTSARFSSASHHQDSAMSLSKTPSDESTLMRYFRAGNYRGIATCLDQLKNDPKRCKEFIKRSNCLDVLVRLLRCENQRIVDRSLSILADACMNDDVREKIRNSKIRFNIVLILENLELNTMLHCRACRLVSNLSECSWHAKELCDAGIMKTLVALLMSKTDVQTYCMAIRAVRNIWNVYKNIRDTMIELEIVKLVAQLFVMAEERSNVDPKYGKLVDACLKAMCIFLDTLDPRCGNQIHVDKDMWGYKCLMRCCNARNNKMAVKCLYTLCQIAECRLCLGVSGTVKELIALIIATDTNSNFICKEILLSLCLFCRESVNRDRIRLNNGLQVILALLNKSEYECYHPKLLEALTLFIHDEIGLDILTRHGILEVLVTKLTNFVAKNSERSSTSRKRSSDYLIDDYDKRPSKYPISRYSMDLYRDDWSPRSATSASSSSPPSTPPLPPYFDFNAEIDDLKDDVYSPVYSDKECDNDEEEEAASPRSYKSPTTVEADSDSSSLNAETFSETSACEYYTLLLLSKLSFSSKPIDKLAESMTIKSLMDYIKYTKKQNVLKDTALKILIKIIGNAEYFIPLVKQGFVFEIQTLPEAEECMRHLRIVADTGGATGQLSFLLLRGEEDYKLLTAVSIPFLIKRHCTLRCLLKKHNGMQLIFRLLADSSHKLHKRAIWSICQLAKAFYSDDSDSITDTTTNTIEIYRNMKPSIKLSSIVILELDDGTTVKACRQTLCHYSPVFSAMLEGHFRESNKRLIRLRNMSRNALKTLILATNDDRFKNRSIESLLEAVLLADYFLMPNFLIELLTETSINKLNHETFYRAWCWARKHSCHEFRSFCVKKFLTTKMSWSETMRTFHDFYTTNAFNEFLCEIRDIITDELYRW